MCRFFEIEGYKFFEFVVRLFGIFFFFKIRDEKDLVGK